ncbi:hypothetical protein LG302_01015 [Halomonas organivorans]
MAFVLKPIPDITVAVPIKVPGEDEPSVIQARWRLRTWDDYQARSEEVRRQEVSDEALVGDDLLDLEGIQDEGGQALDYSPALLEQLMQITPVRQALVLSWFRAQQGREEAAAKN